MFNAIKVTIHGRKSEIDSGHGDLALQVADRILKHMIVETGVTDALPPKIGTFIKAFEFIYRSYKNRISNLLKQYIRFNCFAIFPFDFNAKLGSKWISRRRYFLEI
jgi:hypothetical protein